MPTAFTHPYVDALFEVAGTRAAVERELSGLETFLAALRAVPELGRTLRNPGVPKANRAALLEAVIEKAGCGTLGARLLGVVLQNRRLHVLGDLLAAIRRRLDREANVLEARLATARPLDPALAEEIRALVAGRTGKTIRIVAAVDPALLGGFVVTVGSARYDASLARRLEKAREALHAAPAAR
ncbi:MAG TPA: ATP synthase F1 subunit delta [Thermoanaerobaculia bacterium]|nr:ATP synthase F1 subunit delta [Thermoanaerobaculia bacterium]